MSSSITGAVTDGITSFTEQFDILLKQHMQQQQQQTEKKDNGTNTAAASNSTLTTYTSKDGSRTLEIAQFPCGILDNYGFLLHDPKTGQTAAVDTPWGDAYKAELKNRHWNLTHILNTHHHPDHTMGNWWLKTSDVKVIGPLLEKSKIPCIDETVQGGDIISTFGAADDDDSSNKSMEIHIIDVPGHTLGHIAFYLPHFQLIFVGDALFAMGCGKLFEGTPLQCWKTLQILRDLPDETIVYCAHEYTVKNGLFSLTVEPSNEELQSRVQEEQEKREQNQATIPTTIGLEKTTNPFFRLDTSMEIQRTLGFFPTVKEIKDDDEKDEFHAEVFLALRQAKDNFGGPWWKFW